MQRSLELGETREQESIARHNLNKRICPLIWKKSTPKKKRKIDCAKTVLTSSNANTVRSTPTKPPKYRSETPVPRVKKRRVSAANVEKEDKKLKSQVEKFDKRTK